ncbi:UxaA family hydrolase [Pseudoduganella namucuonensis]|uniref:SAF domain-containing protein n=1 Tax=Pseudoduganella namucuonensis TaxID=1035707 RepID=A0A1I7JZE0_9BURK|nr:UxaA family hydrolase [Pseudoduganella namucuonensis]SFU90588.1 SAF domain-containing protein [Pseudoduganella namucuonensis]
MPTTTAPAAPCLLLMSPEDNCLIARTKLAAGEALTIDGATVVLPEDVPLGYKVARTALRPGDKVLRYGALIGTVTAEVAAGAMLHTHNLASDYIPTYTLGADAHSFIGSTH